MKRKITLFLGMWKGSFSKKLAEFQRSEWAQQMGAMGGRDGAVKNDADAR